MLSTFVYLLGPRMQRPDFQPSAILRRPVGESRAKMKNGRFIELLNLDLQLESSLFTPPSFLRSVTSGLPQPLPTSYFQFLLK